MISKKIETHLKKTPYFCNKNIKKNSVQQPLEVSAGFSALWAR